MNNKVLIKVFFPELDKSFDLFIPVNEKVWKIARMTAKCIFDLNGLTFQVNKDTYAMMNKNTGVLYDENAAVIQTDIRNGTEIMMLKR